MNSGQVTPGDFIVSCTGTRGNVAALACKRVFGMVRAVGNHPWQRLDFVDTRESTSCDGVDSTAFACGEKKRE